MTNDDCLRNPEWARSACSATSVLRLLALPLVLASTASGQVVPKTPIKDKDLDAGSNAQANGAFGRILGVG